MGSVVSAAVKCLLSLAPRVDRERNRERRYAQTRSPLRWRSSRRSTGEQRAIRFSRRSFRRIELIAIWLGLVAVLVLGSSPSPGSGAAAAAVGSVWELRRGALRGADVAAAADECNGDCGDNDSPLSSLIISVRAASHREHNVERNQLSRATARELEDNDEGGRNDDDDGGDDNDCDCDDYYDAPIGNKSDLRQATVRSVECDEDEDEDEDNVSNDNELKESEADNKFDYLLLGLQKRRRSGRRASKQQLPKQQTSGSQDGNLSSRKGLSSAAAEESAATGGADLTVIERLPFSLLSASERLANTTATPLSSVIINQRPPTVLGNNNNNNSSNNRGPVRKRAKRSATNNNSIGVFKDPMFEVQLYALLDEFYVLLQQINDSSGIRPEAGRPADLSGSTTNSGGRGGYFEKQQASEENRTTTTTTGWWRAQEQKMRLSATGGGFNATGSGALHNGTGSGGGPGHGLSVVAAAAAAAAVGNLSNFSNSHHLNQSQQQITPAPLPAVGNDTLVAANFQPHRLIAWLKNAQKQFPLLENATLELIDEAPEPGIHVCSDGPKIFILPNLNDIMYCYTREQWLEKLWSEALHLSTFHYPIIILNVLIFLFGTIGNIFVCLSVKRNYQLRNVTNYFIVNLAFADFLVILICLPATVIWDLSLTWFFDTIPCKLIMYLQVSATCVILLRVTRPRQGRLMEAAGKRGSVP